MNDFPKELFLRPRTAKILAVGRADKEILVLVVQVLRVSPSKKIFSYESLKSRKQRIFLTDELHTRVSTWKPLSLPEKVAPAKARFRVPYTKNFFSWFTSIWVLRDPSRLNIGSYET